LGILFVKKIINISVSDGLSPDHRSGGLRTSGRRPPATSGPFLEILRWQSLRSSLRELATKRPPRSFSIELCLHLCEDILIYARTHDPLVRRPHQD